MCDMMHVSKQDIMCDVEQDIMCDMMHVSKQDIMCDVKQDIGMSFVLWCHDITCGTLISQRH